MVNGAASPITLDIAEGVLTRNGTSIRPRPKTLAVLRILIERRGGVVRRDELRALVWGTRFGNEAGPKQCIRELRRLLGDSPAAPRCIETVGRSGYRLLVPIDLVGSAETAPAAAPICVGRALELAALAARAEAADRGERTIVLVAGEPGAGKTRLTEAFLADLPGQADFWVGHGQCVPHTEAREPYGPLIGALSALANGPFGPRLRPPLRDTAPSWAAQIPGLGDPRGSVRARGGADAAERMTRELGDFLERLTRHAPGILVLEDLHWADPSTLAWLAAWGLRRGSARLLVIGTYRLDEAEESEALGTALRVLGRRTETETLRLGGLDAPAVTDYLARRFPDHRFPGILATALAERTEGHAILIDAVVEQWARRDIERVDGVWTPRRPVPELIAAIATDLRDLITTQIDALDSADRRLLGAASVAGARFSAAALAGGRIELEDIERRLDALARRRRFIEPAGIAEWPDGTAATSYAFRHALYHEALYDLLPAANRQGLHRRIGARLEAAFGAGAAEIAPMLADHFERGGDWRRAAIHRGRSGAAALDRGAAREAANQFRQALSLHGRCVADEDSRRLELEILQGLGAALIVSEGFTAPGLPAVYRRAHDLSRELVDPGKAIPALAGLWNYHVSRADMATADRLAEDLLRVAVGASEPLRMAAHNAAGLTRWFTGDPRACLPHIAAVLDLARSGAHSGAAALLGEDPGVVCRQYAACVHQILGDPEEAERCFEAGIAAARALDQPFGEAQMLWAGAVIARECGDPEAVLGRARTLIALCAREGIGFWLPAGDLMAGWAAAALGDASGLVQLRAGLEAYARMDVRSTRPYSLALLAETAARRGDTAEAVRALALALRVARSTGERWYEAELLRLWAEVMLAAGRRGGALRALRRAHAIGQTQGARLFEIRSSARLIELGGWTSEPGAA